MVCMRVYACVIPDNTLARKHDKNNGLFILKMAKLSPQLVQHHVCCQPSLCFLSWVHPSWMSIYLLALTPS